MADNVMDKVKANRQRDAHELPKSTMARQYQKLWKEILDNRKQQAKEKRSDDYVIQSGFARYKPTEPQAKRLLISGRPGSGKTTSSITFDKQVAVVVSPGEHGIGALPIGEGIEHFVMQQDPLNPLDTAEAMGAFVSVVFDLIDCGEYQTIFIDGIHKAHEQFVNIASDGAKFAGFAFDNRLYGLAHDMFKGFISELFYAATPMIVYTCWCAMEHIDINMSPEQVQAQQILPAFSGRMAMEVLGLLNTGSIHAAQTAYCDVPGCVDNKRKRSHYTWQLMPDERNPIYGDCGFKLPRWKSDWKFPTVIHQDYQQLKVLLNHAWKLAARS